MENENKQYEECKKDKEMYLRWYKEEQNTNSKLKKWRNWLSAALATLSFFSISIPLLDFTVFEGSIFNGSIGKLIELNLNKNTKPSNISLYVTYKPDIEIDSIIGIDQKGNPISFIVLISVGKEQWKYDNAIKLDDSSYFDNINNFVEYLSKEPLFKDSYDIVCVGLASQEGKNTKREEKLATRRGINLCEAVFSVDDKKKIYLLDFGHHNKLNLNEDKETKYQRSIIIIGVTKKNKSKSEIEYALKNAMNKYADKDFYYENYSKTKIKNGFVLTPIHKSSSDNK